MPNAAFHPNSPGTARAEAVLGAIEAAEQVRRRHHFFIWMQSYLGTLVPHAAAVCGTYHRSRRALVYEVFSSVVLPPATLEDLSDPASPLMRHLTQLWVGQGCRALLVDLPEQGAAIEPQTRDAGLQTIGLTRALVHGVSRPMRPSQLESLFVLLLQPGGSGAAALHMLNLLLPHLHATYQRVQAAEHELGCAPPVRKRAARDPADSAALTTRELEILALVRTGLSNQAIGEALSISALTVKNHAQNIFRKLGVNNRTQAVARAVQHRWLQDQPFTSGPAR